MFISIDGCDGCGKTTQIELLAQWLDRRGYPVLTCRDPGTTPLGEAVRELVLHRHDLRIDPRAEMLLYMAARAQLVDEVIRPALAAGKIVLADRYLLANVVYQGYGGGLDVAALWEVGRVAVADVMPDLTIVLDVSPQMAAARLARLRSGTSAGEKAEPGQPKPPACAPGGAASEDSPSGAAPASHLIPTPPPLDRLEQRGPAFQERVREGYLIEAARHPHQMVVIDASASIEAVHKAICAAFEQLLLR